MILLHEDWLLPYQSPAEQQGGERRQEQLHDFFPTRAMHRHSRKTHSVFCNTNMLWMRVKERVMAMLAAIILPNPFLMWDLQRLSWTGE